MNLPTRDALGGRLLTADELAAELGVPRRWVYRQLEEHELPGLRFGRAVMFQLAAVQAWLATRRTGDWRQVA